MSLVVTPIAGIHCKTGETVIRYNNSMSSEAKKQELPPGFDFGGWETEQDKAEFDLSLTVEQRLKALEEMMEFTRMVHGTIHDLR
jgi:hypothetical protein